MVLEHQKSNGDIHADGSERGGSAVAFGSGRIG